MTITFSGYSPQAIAPQNSTQVTTRPQFGQIDPSFADTFHSSKSLPKPLQSAIDELEEASKKVSKSHTNVDIGTGLFDAMFDIERRADLTATEKDAEISKLIEERETRYQEAENKLKEATDLLRTKEQQLADLIAQIDCLTTLNDVFTVLQIKLKNLKTPVLNQDSELGKALLERKQALEKEASVFNFNPNF